MSVHVQIENIKCTLPACKRCRKRHELFIDEYQPVLCITCVEAMRNDWPHMVPLDKPPIEVVRECLWNHDRECNCWSDGLRFPQRLDSEAGIG